MHRVDLGLPVVLRPGVHAERAAEHLHAEVRVLLDLLRLLLSEYDGRRQEDRFLSVASQLLSELLEEHNTNERLAGPSTQTDDRVLIFRFLQIVDLVDEFEDLNEFEDWNVFHSVWQAVYDVIRGE